MVKPRALHDVDSAFDLTSTESTFSSSDGTEKAFASCLRECIHDLTGDAKRIAQMMRSVNAPSNSQPSVVFMAGLRNMQMNNGALMKNILAMFKRTQVMVSLIFNILQY